MILAKGGNTMHKFMRLNDVKAATGLSRSSIYGLIAQAKFPRQVLLCPGGRSVGWLFAEVEEYLEQRIAAR